MSDQQDPFDEIVLDDQFVAGGAPEASGEERIAQARRIAASNERLRRAGEISDGTGKPRFHRSRRAAPWIVIGAVVAVAIVVAVLLVR